MDTTPAPQPSVAPVFPQAPAAPPTPPAPVDSPKKPRSNWPLIIGLVVVLLAGIGAGIFYSVSNLRLPNMPFINPSPTSTPTPTPTPDPTADWKTYTNTALRFELKYPLYVQIDKELNDQYNRIIIFKGDSLHFEVMLRKSGNITLEKYIFMDSPIVRTTTLDGNPANVYELPKGYCDGPSCSEPFIAIVAKKGSDIYHVSFSGDIQLSEVETQILSTFTFLDKTATPSTTPNASVSAIPSAH
jgi:hypothetical protein